jgi:archaellum component FlaF (FlaF/FlaG flagellin family)
MENAITGLIIISVIVLAILGLTEGALSAQAALAEAGRTMQDRLAEQSRTNIAVLNVESSLGGDAVYITLKNTGTTKLADYEHWDVILEYADTLLAQHVEWHAYGQWFKQIYVSAPGTLEKIEPNILNPGEEMVITVPVLFTIGGGTSNVATVATPNGIASTAVFVH